MQQPVTITPIDRSSLQSRTFNALKWILAIVVVISHTFGFVGMSASKPGIHEFDRFLEVCMRGYSVPVFFIISGYLFCTTFNFDSHVWGIKMKKRLFTRGIPVIVFNIFGAILAFSEQWVITGECPLYLFKPKVFYDTFIYRESLQLLFPKNIPLWYVAYLMLMVSISPIVHPLLKWTRGLILVPFLYWYVCGHNMSWFFFYAGYGLRLCNVDLVRFSRALAPWLVPLNFALSFILLTSNQIPFAAVKNFNVVMGAPIIIAFVSLLVERNLVSDSRTLVASTFFLYLTHLPLLWCIGLICGDIIRALPTMPFLLFHLVFIILFSVTVCSLYVGLQRRWPRFMSVITGMAPAPKPISQPEPAMN